MTSASTLPQFFSEIQKRFFSKNLRNLTPRSFRDKFFSRFTQKIYFLKISECSKSQQICNFSFFKALSGKPMSYKSLVLTCVIPSKEQSFLKTLLLSRQHFPRLKRLESPELTARIIPIVKNRQLAINPHTCQTSIKNITQVSSL